MNIFLLADLAEMLASKLRERAPEATMIYEFGDGSSVEVPPEVWRDRVALQVAKLHIIRNVESCDVPLYDAWGVPSRTDDVTDVMRQLATNEDGARLLFESCGLRWGEAPAAPEPTELETPGQRGANPDPWIMRAREYATDIWQRELASNKRPAKARIAREIAGRLWRDDKMVTKRGRRIEANYVERRALRSWNPPQPD